MPRPMICGCPCRWFLTYEVSHPFWVVLVVLYELLFEFREVFVTQGGCGFCVRGARVVAPSCVGVLFFGVFCLDLARLHFCRLRVC